jgi:hypothetical protein
MYADVVLEAFEDEAARFMSGDGLPGMDGGAPLGLARLRFPVSMESVELEEAMPGKAGAARRTGTEESVQESVVKSESVCFGAKKATGCGVGTLTGCFSSKA